MLQKPKYLSPSINMYERTTIDINSTELPFSCIVDGDEGVVSWQIIVSKLSDNTEVFNSGKIDLEETFYPIDSRNRNVVFSQDIKELLEGNTSFINSSEPYYWSITLWGESDYIIHSAEEVFYANDTPNMTIYYNYNNEFNPGTPLSLDTEHPSTTNKRTVYFKAVYTQIQNIPIKRYGWRVKDKDNDNTIIDTITHNQIYGTKDNIVCICEGLTNNSNYSIELYIETQNGYYTITTPIDFRVEYSTKHLGATFITEPVNRVSGVLLDWSNIILNEGRVEGLPVQYRDDYPIEGYRSIYIPDGSSVVFGDNLGEGKLNIDCDAYVVLSFQIDKTQNHTIFTMEGVDDTTGVEVSRTLRYFAGSHTLMYKETKNLSFKSIYISSAPSELSWYIAILTPNAEDFTVVESNLDNALLPSESLYPSDSTYPLAGVWDKMRQTN